MSDLLQSVGKGTLACGIGGVVGGAIGFFTPLPGGAAAGAKIGCGFGVTAVTLSGCGTETTEQQPKVQPPSSPPPSTIDRYEQVCRERLIDYCDDKSSKWNPLYECTYYYPKSYSPDFDRAKDLKTQWADAFLTEGLCSFMFHGQQTGENWLVECEEGLAFRLKDGSYYLYPTNYSVCYSEINPKK